MPDTLPGLTLEEGEPVFNEPWEANAFALVVGLHEKGVFHWNEWAEVLGGVIRKNDNGVPYYESWLQALEVLIARKSLVDVAEISNREREWMNALHATPHGSPIELKNGY